MSNPDENFCYNGLEIAVVGMAGRFPGAKDVDEFWQNLIAGKESIIFFSDEELLRAGIDESLINNPGYVKTNGGILADQEYFDAPFFEYTHREAELMNPQTRLFLECAWEALENAGYDPDCYEGSIGLFAGVMSSYHWKKKLSSENQVAQLGDILLANSNIMCLHISYKLNLTGPSFSFNTTCSSSLVAVDIACRFLWTGQCSMALAGGVALRFKAHKGHIYEEGLTDSADGHCRAFDARASGIVESEGMGVVVLKLLAEATADVDHIWAIVKGSACNNDGGRKASFTAPSIKGQIEVIRAALRMAEVEPESITYIETHGTGTILGDPIEIDALKQALNCDRKNFCAIGSVKTNIGHLSSAAGIASLIKTVLNLKYRSIPPTIHFETPNPNINFENSPFYVNTVFRAWSNNQYPLRAGVSSFGFGGTNAHIVLEEAPRSEYSPESRAWQIIPLSAKTGTALEILTEICAKYFKKNPHTHFADAAYTLQVGRSAFRHRRVWVCSDMIEVVDYLDSKNFRMSHTFCWDGKARSVVFLFPGLGAQYVNMGRELYDNEPVFRRLMDECFDLLKRLQVSNIKEILFPSDSKRTSSQLHNTIYDSEIAQIVVFIFEYALTQLMMTWGVQPQAMLGYSFGEYTAACIAGVFNLEEALKLVILRGKLVKKTTPGAMLSVPLSRQELTPLVNTTEHLSLAIDNGLSCIVSGTTEALNAFEKKMKERKTFCIKLMGNRAFHSALMEPILKEFEQSISHFRLSQPRIPFVSNVTGTWITPQEAIDPAYWAKHLRSTVQFHDGVRTLSKQENPLFIELGPGRDLSAMMSRYVEKLTNQKVINIVRPREKQVSDVYYLLNRLGQLWLYGIKIDWRQFHAAFKRGRIPLPTYPFERRRYWIDRKPEVIEKSEIADWFSVPVWTRAVTPAVIGEKLLKPTTWLLFLDPQSLGRSLEKRLRSDNHEVVTIIVGSKFKRLKKGAFAVNPRNSEDYHTLFRVLAAENLFPRKIIHMWGVRKNINWRSELEKFEESQYLGFFSLLFLAKAIGKEKIAEDIDICVVTNNMQDVSGETSLCPERATVLGPIKVIPQEYPAVVCRSIDLEIPEPETFREEKLLDQLQAELMAATSETVIALKGNHRWIQRFESVQLEKKREAELPLKHRGVYLITGGLGKIALVLAEYLAHYFKARLILTTRSPFPDPSEREKWLKDHTEEDRIGLIIKKLREFEEMGSEILIFQADVSDGKRMQYVIEQSEALLGPLNGVIHAAGIMGGRTFSMIENIGESECREQFRAKAYGVLVLEELLREKDLDFCWLMSSVSTVLGGLEFVAYASANVFMDAWVHKCNLTGKNWWLSVGWDGMSARDTVDCFKRILSLRGIPQIVVSSGEKLEKRIDRWIKLESVWESEEFDPNMVTSIQPRPDLTNRYVEPRNPLERKLTGIWQKLFGFEKIGITDDFVELGGDSLRAMTLTAQIHKVFHIKITVTDILNQPTIKAIARIIEESNREYFFSVVPIEIKEYYPLSAAQRRMYGQQQMKRDNIAYNISTMVTLQGDLCRERLEKVFPQLIRRHEGFRTSFQTINGRVVQRIHDRVLFESEFYKQKKTSPQLPKEIMIGFIRPFDLSHPPLLRVGLIENADDMYILMVDTHHIVADGISHGILVKDFAALYNGGKLSPLVIQYKEFCQWENSPLCGKMLKSQEDYWLNLYSGDVPQLRIPTDYERPLERSFGGAHIAFDIPAELTQQLKGLAVRSDATLFMVLLAGFVILLSRYSGQEDIVVGTPISGRSHADFHHIIGMFVNMLPIRSYPEKQKIFIEFLEELRIRVMEAFENQDYPFDRLAVRLGLQGSLNRNPIFDVVFAMQALKEENTSAQENSVQSGEFQNLTITSFKPEDIRESASFDLLIGVMSVGPDDRLEMNLEFSTELYNRATAGKIIARYIEVLNQIAENPQIRLKDIVISHDLESAYINVPREDQEEFEF